MLILFAKKEGGARRRQGGYLEGRRLRLNQYATVLCQLYLNGLLRITTGRVTGRGTVTTAAMLAPDRNNELRHYCGKAGHC